MVFSSKEEQAMDASHKVIHFLPFSVLQPVIMNQWAICFTKQQTMILLYV